MILGSPQTKFTYMQVDSIEMAGNMAEAWEKVMTLMISVHPHCFLAYVKPFRLKWGWCHI